jgi:hypothetical protein
MCVSFEGVDPPSSTVIVMRCSQSLRRPGLTQVPSNHRLIGEGTRLSLALGSFLLATPCFERIQDRAKRRGVPFGVFAGAFRTCAVKDAMRGTAAGILHDYAARPRIRREVPGAAPWHRTVETTQRHGRH